MRLDEARAATPTDEVRQHLDHLIASLREQHAVVAQRARELTDERDHVARELDRCQMLLDALDRQVAIDRDDEMRAAKDREVERTQARESLVRDENVAAFRDEADRPITRTREPEGDLDVVRRAADRTAATVHSRPTAFTYGVQPR